MCIGQNLQQWVLPDLIQAYLQSLVYSSQEIEGIEETTFVEALIQISSQGYLVVQRT
jgi:hypothetical protein